MAVTNTVLGVNKFNNGIELFVRHIFATNYPALGEPVDYSLLNSLTNRQPNFVQVVGESGYDFRYDRALKLLKVFFGDYNNAADGPLIEIPTAAYPAGVVADIVIARVVWLR